jgi:energy-coupling factor transporter ATP-binding protein EcfA2
MLRLRLEEPRLALLDEPFAALDQAGKRMVESWVDQLLRAGRTVIMASHSIELAARLCSRAIVLEAGQIVWRGAAPGVIDRMSPERLRNGPVSPA